MVVLAPLPIREHKCAVGLDVFHFKSLTGEAEPSISSMSFITELITSLTTIILVRTSSVEPYRMLMHCR